MNKRITVIYDLMHGTYVSVHRADKIRVYQPSSTAYGALLGAINNQIEQRNMVVVSCNGHREYHVETLQIKE